MQQSTGHAEAFHHPHAAATQKYYDLNNLDQAMACGAPVRYSKYTTDPLLCPSVECKIGRKRLECPRKVNITKIQITCFNPETNDFDQRPACEASVCWSKYTTGVADSVKSKKCC